MAISHETGEQWHRQPDDYQSLVEDFRFDLNGHPVVEPEHDRGYVSGLKQIEPISLVGNKLPDGVSLFEITVTDPYIQADPEGYRLITEHVKRTENAMNLRGYSPAQRVLEVMQTQNGDTPFYRSEAGSREEQNIFTRAWTEDSCVEAIRIWRDLVPTAEALDHLLHPTVGREVKNKVGEVAINTPESAIQMRFVADSVAIRDRGVAMQKIAEDYLEQRGSPGYEIQWLSLATGTAEPAIAAAKAVEKDYGIKVNLTVTDIDNNALQHVKENAEKYGMNGNLTTVRANITRPTLVGRLKKSKNGGGMPQYDVVESLGFKEYLPQDGDEIKARRGAMLPQASEFTKTAYSLVKPGGVLISGNMVYPRSQFDYVFGIVDWPIINARSEESIVNIYKEAGILSDPNSKMDIFRVKNALSGLHVYDIVRVSKLA